MIEIRTAYTSDMPIVKPDKIFKQIRNRIKHHVPSRCISYVQYKLLFCLIYDEHTIINEWAHISYIDILFISLKLMRSIYSTHQNITTNLRDINYLSYKEHHIFITLWSLICISTSYWKMEHVSITCYFTSMSAIL